jgi:hypothetical protein
MSDPTILIHQQNPLPKWPIYIGSCCREWPLAVGIPVGRCGLCGERPTFLRADA